jgi:hypothetical protein
MTARIAELKEEIARMTAELARLQAEEVSAESPFGMLQSLGTEMHCRESNSDWACAPLENVNKLKPDSVGKVGELFLAKVCEKAGIPHIYTEDKNSTDGTYDIVMFGKMIEGKTARLGKQGAFQHESLRATGCDYYMFIDITPTDFTLTILPKFDMTQKHPLLGRRPHLRKGTSDVYKFDFGPSHIKHAIDSGASIRVDVATSLESVADFFRRTIV